VTAEFPKVDVSGDSDAGAGRARRLRAGQDARPARDGRSPAWTADEEAGLSETADFVTGSTQAGAGGTAAAQTAAQSSAFVHASIKVAIIGRPNVGKSTLLNALTGSERAIVSPIAGTTRDAVDETIERDGRSFTFVDTAGIRRKGKTTKMAEKLSVVM